MFRFYDKVYEILSSGLFLFILTSSWTFLFYTILPIGFGYFALPLGLIIGIISFLSFVKILISIGLLPPQINAQNQGNSSQDNNQPFGLPNGSNSEHLDLDNFWSDVDNLNLNDLEKERIREAILRNRRT